MRSGRRCSRAAAERAAAGMAVCRIPYSSVEACPQPSFHLRENGLFFEFSLCLSRACLGKMMHFIYKWQKKARFLTRGTIQNQRSQTLCGPQTRESNAALQQQPSSSRETSVRENDRPNETVDQLSRKRLSSFYPGKLRTTY